QWAVGIMSAEEMDYVLDFSFLPEGKFTIEYYKDGINSDRCAQDYIFVKETISRTDKLPVHITKGGGFAAIIY
ncbi:MAG: glycoside hydrolase family 97 C-terminal domain-containing protein, partial [Bacteroidales bacterium]|nr:glycoside hydrolase family 97 C-terminal domain-containing protein [Bacteroidales bacterium]